MLTRGTVKVGTLHDFRKQEALGAEIGDSGEGTRLLTRENTYADIPAIEASPVLSSIWKIEPGATNIHIIGGAFSVQETYSDSYVYCVSHTPSEAAMRKSGYDACVRIDDPEGFFGELTQELYDVRRLITGKWFIGDCQYVDRTIEESALAAGVHPALLKPPIYAYQQETRMMWEPRKVPIKPEVVSRAALTTYLSEYRF